MDVPISEDRLTAISEALFSGRKIEAIKIYRRCAGVDLYEAKRAVEAIEADLRTTSPEKFSRAVGQGCLGAAASMFVFGCIAIFWFVAGLS